MSNNQTPMAPSVPSSERLSYYFEKMLQMPHCGAIVFVQIPTVELQAWWSLWDKVRWGVWWESLGVMQKILLQRSGSS